MKNTTAEEFLQDSLEISHFYNDKYDIMCCLSDDVQLAMQEYAKLKCKEFLEIVSEKVVIKTFDGEKYYYVLDAVDLDSFCS